MSFLVGWGNGSGVAEVDTAAELDADPLPHSVSIVLADDDQDFPIMLEVCLGHPHRSFLYHVNADGDSAWGYEPALDTIDPFAFDHGGQATDSWPERTRVTSTTARTAAREFVTTGGQRPTCLEWAISTT